MRIILIWLIFSLPLLGMTTKYLRNIVHPEEIRQPIISDGRPVPDSPLKPEVMAVKPEQLSQLANIPIFRLPKSDDKPVRFSLSTAAGKNSRLNTAFKNSADALKLNRGLRKLAQLNWTEEDSLKKKESNLKTLQQFLDKKSSINRELLALHELKGSYKIVSAVRDNVTKLEKSISNEKESMQRMEIAKKNRTEAEFEFQKSKRTMNTSGFEKCLDILNKLPKDLMTEEDSLLKKKATFWKHWSQLGKPNDFRMPTTVESITKTVKLFELITEPSVDRPDSYDRNTSEYITWAQEKFQKLSLEEKILKMLAKDISSPADFLKEAVAITKTNPTAKKRLRTAFRDFVKKNIKEKKIVSKKVLAASDKNIQEATLKKNGNIKRGFFTLSKLGDRYKYWPEERGGKEGRYIDLYKDDINPKKPQEPFPIRSLEEYNDAHKKLMMNLNNSEQWISMQKICEDQVSRVAKYLKSAGHGECKLDYSFETSFAKEIVENKELLDILMKNN